MIKNLQLTLKLTIPGLMGGWIAFYWQFSLSLPIENLFPWGSFTQANQYICTLPPRSPTGIPINEVERLCMYSLVSSKPEINLPLSISITLGKFYTILSLRRLQDMQVVVSKRQLHMWELLRRKVQPGRLINVEIIEALGLDRIA